MILPSGPNLRFSFLSCKSAPFSDPCNICRINGLDQMFA